MASYRFPVLHRGVSLVEALVALAVMAFGMLALVGVQATMRLNSDVAKQRGEATRIATEEIEKLRAFRSIDIEANELAYNSYNGMTTGTPAYAAAGGIGNTTFTITRTVVTAAGSPNKSIAVRVAWTDRSNQAQSVTLETAISGTDPALAGLLAVRPTPSATNQINAKSADIPLEAVDLGDGTSAFKPFDTGTVVWIFDHLTGLITSRCTGVSAAQADLTRDNLTNCGSSINGRLLSGQIGFNFRLLPSILSADTAVLKPAVGATTAWVINRSTRRIEQLCTVPAATAQASLTLVDLTDCTAVSRPVSPFQMQCDTLPCTDSGALDAADSEFPRWPALNLDLVRVGTGNSTTDTAQFNQSSSPECFDNAPNTSAAAVVNPQNSVRYYCLIYPASNGWGGRFNLQPRGFSDAGNVAWTTDSAGYKVCRYTTAASDFTVNANHPATYCMENSGSATPSAACSGRRVTGNLTNQNYLIIAGSQNCPTDVAADPSAGDLVNSNTRQHQP